MEITDLLGGDYAIDEEDKRYSDAEYDANPQLAVKHVGDKVYYYDDGLVNWGGLFTLLEYKTGNLSSFINVTASLVVLKRLIISEIMNLTGYINLVLLLKQGPITT